MLRCIEGRAGKMVWGAWQWVRESGKCEHATGTLIGQSHLMPATFADFVGQQSCILGEIAKRGGGG